MAWELQRHPSMWDAIRAGVEAMTRDEMVAALADCAFERVEKLSVGTGAADAAAEFLREWAMDADADEVVDRIMDEIEMTGTADNGHAKVWIDPEGYHRVALVDLSTFD